MCGQGCQFAIWGSPRRTSSIIGQFLMFRLCFFAPIHLFIERTPDTYNSKPGAPPITSSFIYWPLREIQYLSPGWWTIAERERKGSAELFILFPRIDCLISLFLDRKTGRQTVMAVKAQQYRSTTTGRQQCKQSHFGLSCAFPVGR